MEVFGMYHWLCFGFFSAIKHIFFIVVLVNLTACGGGGSDKKPSTSSLGSILSSAASSTTSSSESSASRIVSSSSLSSIAPSSAAASSSVAIRMRIVQFKYDLYNDGEFDTERNVSYTPDGGIAGTFDRYFENGYERGGEDSVVIYRALGLEKDDIDYRSESYGYNTDGYIDEYSSVSGSMVSRGDNGYGYTAGGIINYVSSQFSDKYFVSELLEIFEDDFTYSDKQQIVSVSREYGKVWDVTLNTEGLVETSNWYSDSSVRTDTYHWRTDGRIDLIESYGGKFQRNFNYDDSGRFESMVITNANDESDNVTETVEYDDAGKIIKRYYDLGNDGTQEAMVEYVWELGACNERKLWRMGDLPNEISIADANDPFLAGTGYTQLGYCHD